MNSIDGGEFRTVLGHYPTGVSVVAAMGDGDPVGMVVGSFTSVSLEPPLVAFFPDRKSTTWPKIAAAGRFCVNVLAYDQHEVCRVIGSKAPDKFDALSYRRSALGSPILDGVVAWIDCELGSVWEAGDHFIVTGLVRGLAIERDAQPMIFHKGGYRKIAAIEDATPREDAST